MKMRPSKAKSWEREREKERVRERERECVWERESTKRHFL
jgi:hypothetical protein